MVIFAITFVNSYAAELMIRDIRSSYYRSLEEKSFGFYDSSAVGDLISRATMDLQSVQAFLTSWISTVSDAVFTVIAVLLVMYPMNPTMTLISLLPVPLIAYLQIREHVQTRPLFLRMMLILGKLGAYVQQDIIGMKNVRIFRREEDMEDDFKKVEDKYVEAAIDRSRRKSYKCSLGTAMLWLLTLMCIAEMVCRHIRRPSNMFLKSQKNRA